LVVSPTESPLMQKQLMVESIGGKLSGLLQYLLLDDNAKNDRKKLTTKDIKNYVKEITKKI